MAELKIPQLKVKKTDMIQLHGIHEFECNKLPVTSIVGNGSFGQVVYTSTYQLPGMTEPECVIIKKMPQMLDTEDKKMFFKEVALLHELKHDNIVKLKALSKQPYAIMLEYIYFDFKSFGEDFQISNLSSLLLKLDMYDCNSFHHLVCYAGKEIINGISYMHSQGIAHRDLKPENILVSNQHYANLPSSELFEQFQTKPIICKLTDFGEGRSKFIQTQSMLSSMSKCLDRGTVPYMAPEILVNDELLKNASIEDLMLIDMWALGMIFFCLINPSLKCPWILEARASGCNTQSQMKSLVKSKLEKKELPMEDTKYEVERATCWIGLENIYRGCAVAKGSRLTLEEINHILNQDGMGDIDVVNLNVSQASSLKQLDEHVDTQLANLTDTYEISNQIKSAINLNEATNSCAFIAVKIADKILNERDTDEYNVCSAFSDLSEDTILNLPPKINEHRDVEKLYDAMGAYHILHQQNLLSSSYDFSEELPYADTVFSKQGRSKLHTKLCELSAQNFAAIYVSTPLAITIGCLKNHPFIIDTHPVFVAPGKGNGLILVGRSNSTEVWKNLCTYVWRRFSHGGVKADELQSLAVMTPQKIHGRKIQSKEITDLESKFSELKAALSKHYEGENIKLLIFCLFEKLPIASFDNEGLTGHSLFNQLDSTGGKGYITSSDVNLLLEITILTGPKDAERLVLQYIEDNNIQNIPTDMNTLSPFRKQLFRAVNQAEAGALKRVTDVYRLGHFLYTTLWDVVFKLETKLILPTEIKRFATLLGILAQNEILITGEDYCLKRNINDCNQVKELLQMYEGRDLDLRELNIDNTDVSKIGGTLLGTFLSKAPNLLTLNMKNCKLSGDVMNAMMTGFVGDELQIQVLNISNNDFSNIHGTLLGTFLSRFTKLTELDIKDCKLSGGIMNAMMKGYVGDELQIELLVISNNDFSNIHGMLLGTFISRLTKLTALEMRDCKLSGDVMNEMVRAYTGAVELQDLYITNNDIRNIDGTLLCTFFIKTPKLSQLEMHNCKLSGDVMNNFIRMYTGVCIHSEFQVLYIGCNDFSNIDGTLLGNFLSKSSKLRKLVMHDCKLSGHIINQMFRVYEGDEFPLHELVIGNNNFTDIDGTLLCNFLNKSPKLMVLELTMCHLPGDIVKRMIRTYERDELQLQNLIISGNDVSDIDGTSLGIFLRKASKLSVLGVNNCKLSGRIINETIKVYECAVELKKLYISGNYLGDVNGSSLGIFLSKSQLLELEMSSCKLSGDIMNAIMRVYVGDEFRLQMLVISNNDLSNIHGTLLGTFLSKFANLRHLDMNKCKLTGLIMNNLLIAYARDDLQLQEIFIRENDFSDINGTLLGNLLNKSPKLSLLEITMCQLSGDIVNAMNITYKGDELQLQQLYIGGNDLSNIDGTLLVTFLSKSPKLHKLDIQKCNLSIDTNIELLVECSRRGVQITM